MCAGTGKRPKRKQSPRDFWSDRVEVVNCDMAKFARTTLRAEATDLRTSVPSGARFSQAVVRCTTHTNILGVLATRIVSAVSACCYESCGVIPLRFVLLTWYSFDEHDIVRKCNDFFCVFFGIPERSLLFRTEWYQVGILYRYLVRAWYGFCFLCFVVFPSIDTLVACSVTTGQISGK